MELNLLSLDEILWWPAAQLEIKWDMLLCDPLHKLPLCCWGVFNYRLWCCRWPCCAFCVSPAAMQRLKEHYMHICIHNSTSASSEAPHCVFWREKHQTCSSQMQFGFCKPREHGKCKNMDGLIDRLSEWEKYATLNLEISRAEGMNPDKQLKWTLIE